MRDKIDLVEMLYERSFLNDDEEIILSDGFESALIGITAGEKIAVYDFWKAIDCLLKADENLSFDEALEWLEDYSFEKISHAEQLTPIFIKTL
tara:strand:- start:283 stop:561 length:279 start_codon:yes stop_codon:yes gene_type:complete